MTLKEIENAKFYAEKAYIKDNKYIILREKASYLAFNIG